MPNDEAWDKTGLILQSFYFDDLLRPGLESSFHIVYTNTNAHPGARERSFSLLLRSANFYILLDWNERVNADREAELNCVTIEGFIGTCGQLIPTSQDLWDEFYSLEKREDDLCDALVEQGIINMNEFGHPYEVEEFDLES